MVGEHISFKIAHESDDVELLECAPGEGLRVCPSRGACDGTCLRLRLQTLQHSSTNRFDQDGPSLVQELRAAGCRLLIYETAASRRFDVRDAAKRLHLQTLQLHRVKAEQRDQEGHEHPQRLLKQPGRDRLLMSIMRRRRP